MLRTLSAVGLGMVCAVTAFSLPDNPARPKVQGRLAGTLRDLVYTSPKQLFRLPTPVDGDLGGTVQDARGFVSFMDDLGDLYRIEHLDYDPKLDPLRQQLGEQKFLRHLLANAYLPKTILAAFPDAKFVAESYSTDPSPRLISGWYLPQGSTIENRMPGRPPVRLDAYRAVAVFIRSGQVYFVSYATGYGLAETPLAEAEARVWPHLEKEIVALLHTMQFTDAPPARKSKP